MSPIRIMTRSQFLQAQLGIQAQLVETETPSWTVIPICYAASL
jgi:hypothetical protein